MDNSIFLILEFISGILSFIYIINSFLSLGKYKFDYNKVQIYYDNWNNSPISNILLSVNGRCPYNYDYLLNILPRALIVLVNSKIV